VRARRPMGVHRDGLGALSRHAAETRVLFAPPGGRPRTVGKCAEARRCSARTSTSFTEAPPPPVAPAAPGPCASHKGVDDRAAHHSTGEAAIVHRFPGPMTPPRDPSWRPHQQRVTLRENPRSSSATITACRVPATPRTEGRRRKETRKGELWPWRRWRPGEAREVPARPWSGKAAFPKRSRTVCEGGSACPPTLSAVELVAEDRGSLRTFGKFGAAQVRRRGFRAEGPRSEFRECCWSSQKVGASLRVARAAERNCSRPEAVDESVRAVEVSTAPEGRQRAPRTPWPPPAAETRLLPAKEGSAPIPPAPARQRPSIRGA